MMNREAFVRAQDEHLDIMIALAFDLDDAEAVQQLSETDDPPLTTDDERRADVLLSSAFTKAGQQQRQMRANGFRAVLRKVLPATLRAAACLLLILTVSFSVAFATSAVFRSKVLTLVVRMQKNLYRRFIYIGISEPIRKCSTHTECRNNQHPENHSHNMPSHCHSTSLLSKRSTPRLCDNISSNLQLFINYSVDLSRKSPPIRLLYENYIRRHSYGKDIFVI